MSQTQASLLGDTFGSNASGTIPVGGIIMWSGSIVSIPTGWALCNGANGTPNLQDRFVVGAGSGYGVAGTGGSATATLVSHSHTGTTGGHSADHTHNFSAILSTGGNYVLDGGNDAIFNPGDSTTNGTSNNHSHDFTTSTEGASAANANLPPYYALAFIMRTS